MATKEGHIPREMTFSNTSTPRGVGIVRGISKRANEIGGLSTDPFLSFATSSRVRSRRASLIFQCPVSEKLPPPLWREECAS